jgi:hypothetical protein
MEPTNRFHGIDSASLCSPAGRYDNPMPTRFLAPLVCLKIPALLFKHGWLQYWPKDVIMGGGEGSSQLPTAHFRLLQANSKKIRYQAN